MTESSPHQFTRFDRIRDLSSIDADIPRLIQAAGLAVSSLTNRPLPPQTPSSSTSPPLDSTALSLDPQDLPKHILNTFDDPPGAPSSTDDDDVDPANLVAHKSAFRDASASYYTLLQSISARLRRQVYALEEAGLISETADKFADTTSTSTSTNTSATASSSTATAPATMRMGMGTQQAQQQGTGMQEDGKQAARVSAGIVGPAQEAEREAPVTNGGLGNLDVGWLNSRGEGVERGKEGELVEEVRELLEGVVERRKRDEEMEGLEYG